MFKATRYDKYKKRDFEMCSGIINNEFVDFSLHRRLAGCCHMLSNDMLSNDIAPEFATVLYNYTITIQNNLIFDNRTE